jgi:hypothetical protein
VTTKENFDRICNGIFANRRTEKPLEETSAIEGQENSVELIMKLLQAHEAYQNKVKLKFKRKPLNPTMSQEV